jgi:hypothetical protein
MNYGNRIKQTAPRAEHGGDLEKVNGEDEDGEWNRDGVTPFYFCELLNRQIPEPAAKFRR